MKTPNAISRLKIPTLYSPGIEEAEHLFTLPRHSLKVYSYPIVGTNMAYAIRDSQSHDLSQEVILWLTYKFILF